MVKQRGIFRCQHRKNPVSLITYMLLEGPYLSSTYRLTSPKYNMKLEQNGQAIDLDYANELIQEYLDLDKKYDERIEPEVLERVRKIQYSSEELDDKLPEKLEVFTQRKFNAFVFDAKDLKRLLEDAEHFVVMLGAHPEDSEPGKQPEFKKGSFTIIATGCVGSLSGNEWETVPLDEPAFQYPPRRVVTKLVKKKNKGDDGTNDTGNEEKNKKGDE